jgi:hypothetical protein
MADSDNRERHDIGASDDDRDPVALAAFSYILAAAWVLLPAVQYFATYQRAGVQLELSGLQEPGRVLAPLLGTLDLTPYYLLLIVLTTLFIAARYLARSPSIPAGDAATHRADRQRRLENRS